MRLFHRIYSVSVRCSVLALYLRHVAPLVLLLLRGERSNRNVARCEHVMAVCYVLYDDVHCVSRIVMCLAKNRSPHIVIVNGRWYLPSLIHTHSPNVKPSSLHHT